MIGVTNGDVDFENQIQSELVLSFLTEYPEISVGKLQIALFLVDKKTDVDSHFTYQSTTYGPRIEDFDSLLDSLEQDGYIEIDMPMVTFCKPYTGENHLSQSQVQCIEWVVSTHLDSGLIPFVMRQYPEYFDGYEKSELDTVLD